MAHLKIGNTIVNIVNKFNVSTQNMTKTYIPLRGAPVVLPSAKATTILQFEMEFPSTEAMNYQLIPIISLFHTTPICPFYYTPAGLKMQPSYPDGPMVGGLRYLDISTDPNTVDYVKARLEIIYGDFGPLNYKVNTFKLMEFERRFRGQYLHNMPGYILFSYRGEDAISTEGEFFEVTPDDPELVLSSISMSYENFFVQVPIVGQVHPRLQHIGGTRRGGAVIFHSPGPNHKKISTVHSFFNDVTRTINENRISGKTPESRAALAQTYVANDLLNGFGIENIIEASSRLSEIPETEYGMECVVQFLDMSSASAEGMQKILSAKRKVFNATSTLIHKINSDSTFRNFIETKDNGLYKGIAEKAQKMWDEYSAVHHKTNMSSDFIQMTDQELRYKAQTSLGPQASYEQWHDMYLRMVEERDVLAAEAKAWEEERQREYDYNMWELARDMEDNEPAFWNSDIDEAKAIRTAREQDFDNPGYESYHDLFMKPGENPYDIFSGDIDHGEYIEKGQEFSDVMEKVHEEPRNDMQIEYDMNGNQVGVDLTEAKGHLTQVNPMCTLYPVVKFFIVEKDDPYSTLHSDNLYALPYIDDVMLIRSKELPASTLTLSIHNIWSEILTDEGDIERAQAEAERIGAYKIDQTSLENNINNIWLKPGMRVQLRFGHSNNYQELEVVFNGRITSMEPDGYNIVITAQDSGVSLSEPIPKTDVPVLVRARQEDEDDIELYVTDPSHQKAIDVFFKEYAKLKWRTRGQALAYFFLLVSGSEDFCYPEVGDWIAQGQYVMRSKKDGGTTDYDATKLVTSTGQAKQLLRDHVVQNIKLPNYKPFLDGFDVPPDLVFLMHQNTPWDLLNELVDLYPGYFVTLRPYGTENTLYIGDGETIPIRVRNAGEYSGMLSESVHRTRYGHVLTEMGTDRIKNILHNTVDYYAPNKGRADLWKKALDDEFASRRFTRTRKERILGALKDLFRMPFWNHDYISTPDTDLWYWGWGDLAGEDKGFAFARQMAKQNLTRAAQQELNKAASGAGGKPPSDWEVFRRTHVVDSDYNLIFNSIKQNSETFNAVAVNWSESKSLGGAPIYNPTKFVEIRIPGIDKDRRRLLYFQSKHAINEEMATRIGISLLMKEFGHKYDGEIGILSDRYIRPYDYLFLNDKVNKLFGPLEVRDSILYANKEHGIMTIVVPDLMTRFSNRSTFDIKVGDAFKPAVELLQQLTGRFHSLTPQPSGIRMWLQTFGPLGQFYRLQEDQLRMYVMPLMFAGGDKPRIWIDDIDEDKYGKKASTVQRVKTWKDETWKSIKEYKQKMMDGWNQVQVR